MKITKPKDNQLLIEDDNFKHLDLSGQDNTLLNESEYNEVYSGLIMGFRLPGMGASKQIFACENKLSILTLMSSMLENLVRNEIFTKEELDFIMDAVKRNLEMEE